jgi:hypothetical protein
MTFKLASRVSASPEAADHPHLPALLDQSCTGARAATPSKKMAFIFNSYHRVMNVGAVYPPRKHISYKFVISPATWRADYAGAFRNYGIEPIPMQAIGSTTDCYFKNRSLYPVQLAEILFWWSWIANRGCRWCILGHHDAMGTSSLHNSAHHDAGRTGLFANKG